MSDILQQKEIKNHSGQIFIEQSAIGQLTIPEKKQIGGIEDILFPKPLMEFFISLLYPLEIPDKTNLDPWKFQSQKPRTLEILFFLGHP